MKNYDIWELVINIFIISIFGWFIQIFLWLLWKYIFSLHRPPNEAQISYRVLTVSKLVWMEYLEMHCMLSWLGRIENYIIVIVMDIQMSWNKANVLHFSC